MCWAKVWHVHYNVNTVQAVALVMPRIEQPSGGASSSAAVSSVPASTSAAAANVAAAASASVAAPASGT